MYIGRQPESGIFRGQVETDGQGYIKVSEDMKTNVDCVFAAGDIWAKAIRQFVTAAADDDIAGINAERYVTTDLKR